MAGKINEEWHRKNPMPKNASMEERVVWHKAHAKSCACREIPKTVAAYMKEKNIKP
jgi:hypothetical protein